MGLITWLDKVTAAVSPLPAINKLTAADANMIKSVVNAIITPVGLLKSSGTTVSAAVAGTDYLAAPGGADTNIQYKNGGALAGSMNLRWDEDLGLFVGVSPGQFGNIYLGGDDPGSGGFIEASGPAGILLVASNATGSLQVETNGVERLVIGPDGQWTITGDVGNDGQVLTSQGAGAPVLWRDAPTTVLTGNTVWVDIINGDNGTAIVGRQDKPFATPAAAVAAATSGNLIHVRPGTYNITSNLAKDGVNWYLDDGVLFENVTDGNVVFGDGGVAMTFSVTGYGRFIIDPPVGGTGTRVLLTQNAGTVVSIQGVSATSLGTNLDDGGNDMFTVEGGQVDLKGLFILATGSASDAPVSAGGGGLRMTNVRVDTEDLSGVPAVIAGGTVILHQCTLTTDGSDSIIPIGGPTPVTSYGSYANADASTDITIFGSLTTGSYVS